MEGVGVVVEVRGVEDVGGPFVFRVEVDGGDGSGGVVGRGGCRGGVVVSLRGWALRIEFEEEFIVSVIKLGSFITADNL